jgi:hypothetical protein
MRVEDLIEELQKLTNEHGNCYVLIDSDYDGEVSPDRIEVLPYHETKYFVIKV